MTAVPHHRLGIVLALCLGLTGAYALAAGVPAMHRQALATTAGPELPASGLTRTNILKLQATKVGNNGYTFLYMGDSRDATAYDRYGDLTYRRIIQAANRSGARFAIHGGDFTVDNRFDHWQRVRDIDAGLHMPLLTVIGNHEVIGNRSYYESTFGAPNPGTGLDDYSFDYGGVRFIALDNANLTLTNRQFAWLQRQLRTDRVKIVTMHAPPALGIWIFHSMLDYQASNRFLQMMDAARVDMVLLSHIHSFDDSVRRGRTQYLISGGAGAPLTPFVGYAGHHVVLIHVAPGGKLTYRMVPVS